MICRKPNEPAVRTNLRANLCKHHKVLSTLSIPNILDSVAKHGRVERFRNDVHRLLLQAFRLFVLHHFGCHEDDQSNLERFNLSKGAKRFKSIYSRIIISRT